MLFHRISLSFRTRTVYAYVWETLVLSTSGAVHMQQVVSKRLDSDIYIPSLQWSRSSVPYAVTNKHSRQWLLDQSSAATISGDDKFGLAGQTKLYHIITAYYSYRQLCYPDYYSSHFSISGLQPEIRLHCFSRWWLIVLNVNTLRSTPHVSLHSYVPYANFMYCCLNGLGPNAVSVSDFVQMIWDQRPPVMVMLTRLVEKGKVNYHHTPCFPAVAELCV